MSGDFSLWRGSRKNQVKAPTHSTFADGHSESGFRQRFGLGMTTWLAWRNLVHDNLRLAVTVVGISFSVVLMAVQWGLLTGSANTAAGLVDNTRADFWIASRGTSNVDQSVPMPERWRYKVSAIPGVFAVDPLITRFVDWRRPDGASEVVIVVGFDLDSGVGAPWNVVAGSVDDLHKPDSVIIDRLYAEKLGVHHLGETIEIHGVRARVVGLTNGIRAFTQSPYVFTSIENAQRYGGLDEGQTNYLLVRGAPGADRAALGRELRQALPVTDVLSADAFAKMTARYWLLSTGAGAALVVGALLGVVVGIIVVGQTLYAATVERLSEYATLLAMGAPTSYLNRVVLQQALISGGFGYGIGIAVAAAIAAWASDSSVSLPLSFELAAGVAVVTVAMCVAASLLAIRKIKNIDPMMVFR
jgi:putative ABC transport system permease protein